MITSPTGKRNSYRRRHRLAFFMMIAYVTGPLEASRGNGATQRTGPFDEHPTPQEPNLRTSSIKRVQFMVAVADRNVASTSGLLVRERGTPK